ncbi:hypothetical protein P3G55_20910 [Leptospira sp. 96542]|nr:hypothetical protein [Leptospira sp. 96542]
MSDLPDVLTLPLKLNLSLSSTPESRRILDALGLLAGIEGPAPTTGVQTSSSTATTLTPPAIGELWMDQGGIYGGVCPAFLDQPAAHMVWSEKEWEDFAWGERGHDIVGASSRINGQANTRAMLAVGNCPAAIVASNYRQGGHSDFFLPSQFHLFIASLLAPELFKKDGWYWSSTQLSAYNAFAQDFEYGYSYWYGKDLKFRVRALRLIQL